MKLFAYQDMDITRAIDEGQKSIFLAYEQALGKTITAVEFAKRLGLKSIIVVAPLSTRRSWEATVKSQIPDAVFYHLEDSMKSFRSGSFTRLKKGEPGWYFIGWEFMRTGAITGNHADLIIADEVHRIQNRESWTRHTLQWISSDYKIALSGTPSANKPEGLFPPMNWLWPERYKSYTHWVKTFWHTLGNRAVPKLDREIIPGGVIRDMPFFIRRLKKDHRGDMPPVLPTIEVSCEMAPLQRKIYNQFQELALVWLGEHPLLAAVPFTQSLRLRQLTLGVPIIVDHQVTFAENAKSSKIDALVEIIEDRSPEETYFVLSPSARFIPVVISRLRKAGITAEAYTGKTEQKERERLLREFGGSFRVLVAGIAAVAEGLDGLQHKCSNGVWLSKHVNALLNTQAGERLDRPGQLESVQWWNLIAPDTIDEGTEDRLRAIGNKLSDLYDPR
ncbi:SNF2-related protein [Cryobacterium sp. TMT1-66-1]|uniref:SNF2-related protein n=1 Tax=Cryobacterium sp. TMT1-66-1 TaxID=1259242 RepID=UPI00351A37CF